MTENCNDCKYEKECNHTGKYDYTYDKIMDYQTNKEYNSFKDICDLLNEQEERINELEEENGRMKGAFKRKFDYDIEDVVDEICDEDW